MNDESVRGGTRLSDVAEFRNDRRVDCLVEVGIFEDDERGVASELHRCAEHVLSRQLHERNADGCRSREAELAQTLVTNNRVRYGTRRRRGEYVHYTGGDTALLENLDEIERRERGESRGLNDDRVAGCERRGNLAGSHGEREVPRGDEEARSDRHVRHEHPAIAFRRLGVATVDAHCFFTEPAQELRAVIDLAERLRKGLSHLNRHEQGEFILALLHLVERAAQNIATRSRAGLAPRLLCGNRSVECAYTVSRARIGNLGDEFAGRRVKHVERLAAFGIDPFAVDVELRGNLREEVLF